MALPRAVRHERSSHLAGLVGRRNDYGYDDTQDGEFIPVVEQPSGHGRTPEIGLPTSGSRLAIVLIAFATPRWTIPLAAWLYPIFLLRFVRTQPLLRGVLLVLLATVLVFVFALQGVFTIPGALYYLVVFAVGVIYTLPYLIDRVVAPRLGGMLGTLVFPLAMTTVWYLNALLNPLMGTYGNPAYTQYGNLPLLQLLSVTGLWGIVFLMSWLASVVNWAWERGFAWPKVRGGAVAVRQSPRTGPAVWGRASGPLPRAGQHGAGRRDHPFTSAGSSVLQATLPEKLAGAFLRDSNAG